MSWCRLRAISGASLTAVLCLGLMVACGSDDDSTGGADTGFDIEFTDTVEVSTHAELEAALEQAEEIEVEGDNGDNSDVFRILVVADIDFDDDDQGWSYGGDVPLYIGGTDGDRKTIDASGAEQQILSTDSTGEDLFIEMLRFTGADYGSSGGVLSISDSGNLYIKDAHFDDNHASNSGGVLDTGTSTAGTFWEGYAGTVVSIENSIFEGNTANRGGALSINAGRLEVTNSEFVDNEASEEGGAIATHLETEIEDSRFEGNRIETHSSSFSGTAITAIGKPGDNDLEDSERRVWVRGVEFIDNVNTGTGPTTAITGASVYGEDEGNIFDPADQEPDWEE